MRYFHYEPSKDTAITKRRTAPLRYHTLLWGRTIVIFIIFVAGFTLTSLISGLFSSWWSILLCRAIGFILYIFILFRLVKYWTLKKPLIRPTSADACAHLREYYGISGEFLITKCYFSSVPAFAGKDICLFFAKNELRITTDIVNGFLDMSKDLGCYALSEEEFSFGYTTFEDKQTTEIKDGNFSMIVGRRAKAFIEEQKKQFSQSERTSL